MKEKKKLTPSQRYKKLKTTQYICFGGEFVSVLTPFIVVGIVNYNEYFVEYNGTRVSIACALAFALMGIAVYLVSKKKFDNSFITLIVGWLAITIIFFLLGKIITDISWIMLYGLIGILGAYGLDIASAKAEDKAKKIKDGMELANQEEIKEEYREEKESKKTVKVKVKKKETDTE